MPEPRPDADLPRLRSELGASSVVWAGPSGVRIEAGRWLALSGAFSPRYNVVLCHGPSVLAGTIEEIAGAGVPAIIMVAGAALDDSPALIAEGWVRFAEMPFMIRRLGGGEALLADPAVRRLHGSDIAAARELMADVFSLHDRLARVALPPDTAETPGHAVWGAFDEQGALASCVITVEVGETLAIWSLATARSLRRLGHAARLMNTVLSDAAAQSARASLLYAPVEAEPFYLSLGYQVLERWQLWSRPRWGFGRP